MGATAWWCSGNDFAVGTVRGLRISNSHYRSALPLALWKGREQAFSIRGIGTWRSNNQTVTGCRSAVWSIRRTQRANHLELINMPTTPTGGAPRRQRGARLNNNALALLIGGVMTSAHVLDTYCNMYDFLKLV